MFSKLLSFSLLFQNTFVSTRPWEPSTSFSPVSAGHARWKRPDAFPLAWVTLEEVSPVPLPPSATIDLKEKVASGYFHYKVSLQQGFTQISQLLEWPQHNPHQEYSKGRPGEVNINSPLISGSRKQTGKYQINTKTTVRRVFQGFEEIKNCC